MIRNLLSVFHRFSVRYFSICQFFFYRLSIAVWVPPKSPSYNQNIINDSTLRPFIAIHVPEGCGSICSATMTVSESSANFFGAQNQIKDSFIHKIKPQSLGNKPVHFVLSTISFIIITIWATAETLIFHVNNNSFPGLVLWKTFEHVLITM